MKRKKFLPILALILVWAAAAALAACSPREEIDYREETVARTPLAAPENARMDGEALKWEAVENAAGYTVAYLCEEEENPAAVEVSAGGTEYAFSLSEPGVYSARVRATAAADSFYSRSPWSDWIPFRYVGAFRLPAPANLTYEGDTVSWPAVENAAVYEVRVNAAAAVRVSATEYTVPAAAPGADYAVEVRAVSEDSLYYGDSEWASLTFRFTVAYAAPANLRVGGDGFARWDETEYLTEGYTASVRQLPDGAPATGAAEAALYDVTLLPTGDYALKVMVNGGADGVTASSYTEEIKFRVTQFRSWDAAGIVSEFTSWNKCTAAAVGDYASLRCEEGWGGLVSPALTVNYELRPVLVTEYLSVPFGYMGNFYLGGGLYIYAPDIRGPFGALSVHSDMARYMDGAIPSATGVVSGVSFSIGFTYAPVGAPTREVAQVKNVRIVYVTEIPEIPDELQDLSAPSDLQFNGLNLSWRASPGNAAYTPTYTLEILKHNGTDYVTAETLNAYPYTSYNLGDLPGFSPGRYSFRVTADGDGAYFSDSQSARAANMNVAVTALDLATIAASAANGIGVAVPNRVFEDGKLKLTLASGYGTIKYTAPTAIDVRNSYLTIDFDSITGGNYYIRLPEAGGNAGNVNTIVSGDSSVTGPCNWKLTDVPALADATGTKSFDLHLGISGSNMTCYISKIAFVTVAPA
ncbi:MAG: hypothetical protein LBL66_04225 [Clostridiales bacterium]|jgi:hypothetical protein|nr:hypothetical protein [Clostridiales bacterium]